VSRFHSESFVSFSVEKSLDSGIFLLRERARITGLQARKKREPQVLIRQDTKNQEVPMKNSRHQKINIQHPVTDEIALKPYPEQTSAGDPVGLRELLACVYPELMRLQRIDIHSANKVLRRDRRRLR
jgi:hypothetical protein